MIDYQGPYAARASARPAEQQGTGRRQLSRRRPSRLFLIIFVLIAVLQASALFALDGSGLNATRRNTSHEGSAGRDSGELPPIFFATGSFALNEKDKKILDRLSRLLSDRPSVRLTIIGHTDERGTHEYSLAIAGRRANEVYNYLIGHGVAARRLTTLSYGREKPSDPGHTPAAWARNRRVEFVAEGWEE